MTVTRVYLDHNATSPLREQARVACWDASGWGNPSSVHAEGRRARAALEIARSRVAALVDARPEHVVFTSGGTEANNMALRPGALLRPDGRLAERLLVGAGEHVSVLAGHGFPEDAVERIRIDGHGRTDLDHLEACLRGARSCLVSIQIANSETGAVQPIREVAALARSFGAALHVDAVQAAGRVPMADLAGADALTLSGHKLGGPMGAGALVVASGRAGPALRFVSGGGQERGFRGGTENLPAIVGFGVAAEIAGRDLPNEATRLRRLRDEAKGVVRRLAPDAFVFAEGAERLPNTLAFAVPGMPAETALIGLDLAGVAVSSGSACSSGKVGRSHVLAAMGVPGDLAAGAIRLSFGWNSTHEDVSRFEAAFGIVLQRLYERGQSRAA